MFWWKKEFEKLQILHKLVRFPFGVFLLADEKSKEKKLAGRKEKLNDVQLSFESASLKICKNQLTNQIEENAEYFSTRKQKNSQRKTAFKISKT